MTDKNKGVKDGIKMGFAFVNAIMVAEIKRLAKETKKIKAKTSK